MLIYALTALHLKRFIWLKRLFFIFHTVSLLKNAFCFFTTILFHPLLPLSLTSSCWKTLCTEIFLHFFLIFKNGFGIDSVLTVRSSDNNIARTLKPPASMKFGAIGKPRSQVSAL